MAGRMLRLLGVLTVVAGVFAMHGLTSHHDAAMAAPGMVMTHTEPAGVHVDPLDDMHDMGGACMAVLTGLVLLLALALGLRSQLVWRAVSLPATSARFVLGERSPPRSVSSLGVLRI
ncbi:DUF6153 family protein [Kribbella sindirgiensis]|uniref:Uncharacterized protein n=1 Tax=Kribbella sindirgiensis TaxID=1124744 RepID=A0A4R0IYU3_9ACTN|nr:DUF6153 family protein [Kribbella sindirgiensis]TCC39233.1 hypothetical protein E0H50_04620 [Kribbella sindirgiensis]